MDIFLFVRVEVGTAKITWVKIESCLTLFLIRNDNMDLHVRLLMLPSYCALYVNGGYI